MNREQHRRAIELFERLRGLPPAEREKELDSACGSDGVLKESVRGLLEADEEAPGGFLSQPAIETAARWVEPRPEPPDVMAGIRLGQYRLIRVIGAGGMGAVYEAVDERLNRPVAVKVLPAEAVQDPERLRRFQQEARAASLLNHPNIVSVYDASADGGRHYLATELVIGKTLRALIEEGPADSKTVLEIGAQVASALDAAHHAGIVHRDIKPENVMLRPDGFVKVLDFGLAKLREPASGEKMDLTRPGQVAGTLRYLSPEQVMGKPVGPRSDIFSLGVLLYELSTAVRPFDGPTDGAVFNAISNRAPVPPAVYRPDLPPAVERLILRALEKDPDLRFQTAGDLRAACRQASRDSQEIPLPAPERSWLRPALAGGALTAAILLAAAGFGWPRAAVAPARFERLTLGPGEETWPSLAGDAKQFVYSSAAQGKWNIFLQRTGGMTPVNLTGDSGADDTQPALSPSGGQIVFRSSRDGGGLFLMGATGENPRRLTREGFHPAWSADGKQVAYSTGQFATPGERGRPDSRLRILDVATGQVREIPFADAIQPAWSPHGKRLAFWSLVEGGRRDILTVGAGVSPAPPVAVTSDAALDWNPVWSPGGDALFFLSDRGGTMNVWRVRINEDTGQTRGPPEPVTLPADTVSFLSLAAGGAGMVYGQVQQRINVGMAEFDPAKLAVTGIARILTGQTVTNMSFSPDGQKLVSDAIGDPQEDLWIMNKDGSGRRRLTSDLFKDRVPSWSPRGDEILFFSDRGGKYDLWVIRPDGSDLRRLTDAPHPMQMSLWNQDGSRIFAAWNGPGNFWVDPKARGPVTGGPALKGLEKGDSLYVSTWPPSGDLLVGERNGELVLYSFTTGRVERTHTAAKRPCWIPGSGLVVFGRGGKAILYDPVQRRERELVSVEPNRWYACAAPPGGRQIYFSEVVRESDIWYAEFPPPGKFLGLF
jgi:Tol biopolymer transport system component